MLDDPNRVRVFVMDEATFTFRRLLDRFGKRTEKLGHLHHIGAIRSSGGDDGIRTIELNCECGALLGPRHDSCNSTADAHPLLVNQSRDETVAAGLLFAARGNVVPVVQAMHGP